MNNNRALQRKRHIKEAGHFTFGEVNNFIKDKVDRVVRLEGANSRNGGYQTATYDFRGKSKNLVNA